MAQQPNGRVMAPPTKGEIVFAYSH